MSWLWRMLMVVAVALMPGGFVLLLAYVASRTVWERWQVAQVQALTTGTPASLRAVIATVDFKELVRQARTAL